MFEIKDPENFEKLKLLINKVLDFNPTRYTDSFLSRRFEVRLRANNLDRYDTYINMLQSDDTEKEKLSKELAIHVTNFFRDNTMWDFFKSDVISKLVKDKNKQEVKEIKVWSAGCSTGEEPVSIAICFLENLGLKLGGFKISIHATDIDLKTVEKAKQGIYEDMQFREMNDEFKKKYFDDIGDGLFKVKDYVKDMIEYKQMDLFVGPFPNNLDIIFCRNTVIYFNLEAKSELYLKFYDHLSDKGFFVMGKTEILQGSAREKLKIYDSRERIYLKDEV